MLVVMGGKNGVVEERMHTHRIQGGTIVGFRGLRINPNKVPGIGIPCSVILRTTPMKTSGVVVITAEPLLRRVFVRNLHSNTVLCGHECCAGADPRLQPLVAGTGAIN